MLFRRTAGLESTAKTTLEMVVINWFAEVANDPIFQSATPDTLVRICGNEDRWDRVPCVDQMSVELDASHSRHLDVGDQAAGLREHMGCQEIGSRGEGFDYVTQRGYEFPHGLAKRLIILDDRY